MVIGRREKAKNEKRDAAGCGTAPKYCEAHAPYRLTLESLYDLRGKKSKKKGGKINSSSGAVFIFFYFYYTRKMSKRDSHRERQEEDKQPFSVQ